MILHVVILDGLFLSAVEYLHTHTYIYIYKYIHFTLHATLLLCDSIVSIVNCVVLAILFTTNLLH